MKEDDFMEIRSIKNEVKKEYPKQSKFKNEFYSAVAGSGDMIELISGAKTTFPIIQYISNLTFFILIFSTLLLVVKKKKENTVSKTLKIIICMSLVIYILTLIRITYIKYMEEIIRY